MNKRRKERAIVGKKGELKVKLLFKSLSRHLAPNEVCNVTNKQNKYQINMKSCMKFETDQWDS